MILDPVIYYKTEPSLESLVLSFCIRKNVVLLVIDYAWEYMVRPDGQREFRLLRYEDVSGITMSKIRSPPWVNNSYQLQVPGRSSVVEDEKYWRDGSGFKARLYLCDLGGFRFRFQEFHVTKMMCSVKQVGDDWIYRDEQGELVNFYRPFGDVCGDQEPEASD